MLEVRFHGRGGQGTVLASHMLCKAAFLEGKDVQSFTFFGAERRGAPVASFARIDSRPIAVRSQIYRPNRIVVLDPGLLRIVDVLAGSTPDCMLFFNGVEISDDLSAEIPADIALFCMDVTDIALRHRLGTAEAPIVNTAVLGGFAGATRIVGWDALEAAVRDIVPRDTEGNVAVMREAYERAERGRDEHGKCRQ